MKDIFIDTFKDGIEGVVLGIIVWTLSLLVLSICGYGLFYLADATFLDEHTGAGVIVDRWHQDSYVYVTYVHSGKVTIPVVHHQPEYWHIKVLIKDCYDNVIISRETFNNLYVDEKINCQYVHGRISNYVYIKSFTAL